MRKFTQFLLFTIILGILASVYTSRRFPADFPPQLGTTFDDNLRLNHRDYLNAEQPRMVIMGDSTLRDSVDFAKLSQLLGFEAYEIAIPGSGSAMWYLMLKNNILTADHKPDHVVIFTRETILTTPEYRVDGHIFLTMDEYAAADEPLVQELSYMQQYTPLERLAETRLPLYAQRQDVRDIFKYRIETTLPVRFGCGVGCVQNALDSIFLAEVDTEAIREAQERSENYLWGLDKLLFQRQLNRSYLPEFERMTRENDIQLILVEMKIFRSPPSTTTSLLREVYLHDLRNYCAENDILFISFADDPRLTEGLFPDGFHLAEEAIPMFTDMLAEELIGVIED